jgi:WhiB family redox-sensing transcriptional regulator
MENIPTRPEELAEAVRGVVPRPDWLEWVACKDADPRLFFPGVTDQAARHRACEICDRCIVWQECLAHILDRPDRGGIWAGTSEPQRRKIRRLLRRHQEGDDKR